MATCKHYLARQESSIHLYSLRRNWNSCNKMKVKITIHFYSVGLLNVYPVLVPSWPCSHTFWVWGDTFFSIYLVFNILVIIIVIIYNSYSIPSRAIWNILFLWWHQSRGLLGPMVWCHHNDNTLHVYMRRYAIMML